MKYTDPKEVLILAKEIGTDIRQMEELCGSLRQDLNTLKETFLDDQIQDVEDALNKIQALVNNNTEAAKVVLTGLIQYANALSEIKRMK